MVKTELSGTRYARNCHEQPNANKSDADLRNGWDNTSKASSVNAKTRPAGAATSTYHRDNLRYTLTGQGKAEIVGTKSSIKTKTKSIDRKPWTFAANDFDFTTDNIPKCAYISKVKFIVRIKVSGNIKVKAPQARFNIYGGDNPVSNNIKEGTGWQNGDWYVQPSVYLSNSYQLISYEMSGKEFHRRGYSNAQFYKDRFGIDLLWNDAISGISTNTVSIDFIACDVTYEIPDHQITIQGNDTKKELHTVSSESEPMKVIAGEPYTITAFYRNESNSGCCSDEDKEIKVTLPPNARAVRQGGVYEDGIWTVQCVPNGFNLLRLEVTDYGIGTNPINFYNEEMGSFNFYVKSFPQNRDIGDFSINARNMQEGVESCIELNGVVNSHSDDKITFNVNVDVDNQTNPDVTWYLDKGEGASIDYDESTNSKVVLNVPVDEAVDFTIRGCFLPSFTGESSATATLVDGATHTTEYNVLDAPKFIVRNIPKTDKNDRTIMEIGLTPSTIQFRNHRVASSTELGAYVIECGVAEDDGEMIEDECTLKMEYWEKIDYIGCVPLEYHHYDPNSTYSNKAISEAYKNKTYKGKTGEIDETITLKFKARPKQVPTLQGLVKMDKPTPINANHKCFESDPLNHRGWAVLSEIKAERTNPLWYDCEADVDYITHDINTKFQIYKENKVNTSTIPELLADTIELGENLSTTLDTLDIQTDGGFIYDEEGEDGARNLFSLDEGETLTIKSRQALSPVSNVRVDWYSNRNSEFAENVISRIFRLRDDKGNALFEYEYTDFVFEDEYVTCTVIKRVKNEFAAWVEQIITDVDLKTEIEADPINTDIDEVAYDGEDSDEEEDEEGDAYEEGYIAPDFNKNDYDITLVYGSSLELHLNGNLLSLYDAGFNGREVVLENIELLNGKYFFETVWVNQNIDGTTEDIVSYIDVGLEETVLNAQYSEIYNNLYVSPFPIPYKKVVFTRESEEGTIYYLTGQEPFKYMIEPYYQYHCGCDLLGEGVSIFDLNNSYTHYYVENGLVRFGFNKHNGRIYIAKWDIISKEWITTHYFHMVDEPKFAIESFSDDKIVVKAGNDTYFTIWRGHPYIGINNPTDTLYIDNTFEYCLTDKINGESYLYPQIFGFLNKDNLLPNGIGGIYLDYDLIGIDDDYPPITPTHDITLTFTGDMVAENPVTIAPTITGNPNTGKVHYFVDEVEVDEVASPFTLQYNFPQKNIYKVYAVYVGEGDDFSISPTYNVEIKNAEFVHSEDPKPLVPGEWNLKIISAPKKFVYKDNEKCVVQLTKNNEPQANVVVEAVLPDGRTWSAYTKSNGTVEVKNEYGDNPGTYEWGARLWDTGRLICKALKKIPIVKATPTLSHNDVEGKVSKGKSLKIKLKGQDGEMEGAKLTYTLNGGSKKSKTTNDNGNIYIKFNKKGTYVVKVMYAGNKNYDKLTKKFTIKVV